MLNQENPNFVPRSWKLHNQPDTSVQFTQCSGHPAGLCYVIRKKKHLMFFCARGKLDSFNIIQSVNLIHPSSLNFDNEMI
jgi:hypothetical protein